MLHTEGLYRKSGDYAVPRYRNLKRLPDSHADSQTGSIGLSWVGEKALSAQHTATVATATVCLPTATNTMIATPTSSGKSLINKRYLQLYPHLLTEEDIDYDNPGLSCGFTTATVHTHTPTTANRG